MLGLLLAATGGCASTGGDPRDPFEGFNRAMYGFNETFDAAIAKPVATAYKDYVPEPMRDRVRNFFSNIGDLFIGFNNLLQGKPEDTMTDWARFVFNSTFGLFGIHDLASEMGLEKHNEDFGQTFGRWGADSGPYIVWPFLGPSTVRDSAGLVFDIALDPVTNHSAVPERNSAIAVRFTGQRADLLDASSLLEQAALDKYVFLRDAYLQRRRSLIYDGSPPREKLTSRQSQTTVPAPAPTGAVQMAGEGAHGEGMAEAVCVSQPSAGCGTRLAAAQEGYDDANND
jgi:phospholipid-binding lipoprotein MlaA